MVPFLTRSSFEPTRRVQKKMAVLAFLLFFFAAVWYAVAANGVVAASYRYHDILMQRQTATRDVEALRVRSSEALAPEALEIKAHQAGFTQITKPQYLPLPGTLVAQR